MFPKLLKLSILFILLLASYNTASASFTISRPSTNNFGLVGHWTFDGKNVVSGVALDSAGSNNGNLIGIATSTFYSIGKIGQGFNFDGTDDYVNIGDTFYSDIFTICAWFKADSLDGATASVIAAKRNNSGVTAGPNEWEFRVEYGKFTFVSWNSGAGLALYIDGTATVNLNQWYHGCSVQKGNGNTGYVYLNGVEDDNAAQTSAMINSSSLIQIGARTSNNNVKYWDGLIDDVRIYNRGLSAGEVAQLYYQGVSKFNKTPTNILTYGLVGHWTFDGKNVVNGVALDSAGSNNGNLISIATSTFYAAGKIGQGFSFDGINQAVSVPDSAPLSITGNITVSAWVNAKDLATADPSIVDKRSGGNDSYQLALNAIGAGWNAYFNIDTGSGLSADATSEIPFNTWAHIAGVWDGSIISIYINGVLEDTTSQTGSMSNTADALLMGLNHSNTGDFKGRMDDARVYNRALSGGEVKMLYNMGR